MKRIVLCLLCVSTLFAEVMQIDAFETNLLSKYEKKTKRISLSLVLEGRDLLQNEYRIYDAINVIVGSFYAEDMVTSKIKESFKQALISYLAKQEAIGVEKVYIQHYLIETEPDLQEILEKLKPILPTN